MTDGLKPIVFGNGDKVIITGFSYGQPAVFIAPAKQLGEVGASAEREGNPRDTLLDGEIVLTFPTEEQAKSVADALCNVKVTLAPAVKVKALVWRDSGFDQDADFIDTTETYQIQEGIFWYASQARGTPCGSNEAAKAAAQADYEARIMSALEPATPLDDPRVKALVEAVRHEREMVCQDFDMQSAAARAVDAALSALEENK